MENARLPKGHAWLMMVSNDQYYINGGLMEYPTIILDIG